MADEPEVPQTNEEQDPDANYKPPPMKSMNEMLELDQDDESLKRYKEALLGGSDVPIPEPNDPRRVIVKKLALVVEGRPDIELDLTGDLNVLKNQVFVIKEGVHYAIRIDFIVQREIVTGLKYVQKTNRKMIQVDKMKYMVGSYAPKMEIQSYKTTAEEAPSGIISRGNYNVKSCFTDDDKNIYLEWEWTFEIKKDWD